MLISYITIFSDSPLMTLSPQHLPGNISGMSSIDSSHLLTSVSPTALMRAEKWYKGAELIDATLGRFEEIMNIGVAENDDGASASIAE